MNIVYKLENLDSKLGPRYYIGSKTNCDIIDGEIVDRRTGLVYQGSSANPEMVSAKKRGDEFKVIVLEEVIDISKLLERENFWITYYNAVECNSFYNLSYATLDYKYDTGAVVNRLGETLLEVRDSKIRYNRRRTSCKQLGFRGISSLVQFLYILRQAGETFENIANTYGKNRHFYQRLYNQIEVENFLQDLENLTPKQESNLKKELRRLYSENLSYTAIAKELNVSLLMFDWLFNNWDLEPKTYSCTKTNRSRSEVLSEILEKVGRGQSLRSIAKDIGLGRSTVTRYYRDYVQSSSGASDT